MWSGFHDGFDEQKYHLRCGKNFAESLDEIRCKHTSTNTAASLQNRDAMSIGIISMNQFELIPACQAACLSGLD